MYIVSVAKTSNHIFIACFLQRQGIVLQCDTLGIHTELSCTLNDTRLNGDFYYAHCRPFYRSPNLIEFKTCTFDTSSYHNLLLKSFQSLVPYLTNLPDFFSSTIRKYSQILDYFE